MADLVETKSTTTSTTTRKTPEVFDALRAGHEAAGGVWPDFGAGENDGGTITVTKANGDTFTIGYNSDANADWVVSMGDGETL